MYLTDQQHIKHMVLGKRCHLWVAVITLDELSSLHAMGGRSRASRLARERTVADSIRGTER